MREITGHRVNPANDRLTINVADEPGAGGANHRYEITGFDATTNPGLRPLDGVGMTTILFQNGPIAEAGVNGVTHEALIAILIDRLQAFQNGPFSCTENALALLRLEEAQEALHSRTLKRMSRGVEGTHNV